MKSADDPARVATGIAVRGTRLQTPVFSGRRTRRAIAGLIAASNNNRSSTVTSVCHIARPGRSSSSRVPFQVAGRARRLSDADLGGRAMTIGPVEGAHVHPRPRLRNLLFVGAACARRILIICLGTFRSASAATGHMAATSHLNAMPSALRRHLAAPGAGYWLAASDGGIFSEAGAPFKGSAGNMILNKPIVGIAADTRWQRLLAGRLRRRHLQLRRCRVRRFGGRHERLNQPIVGMAATPDGKGYWLVASDGGIFNYGDAALLRVRPGGITFEQARSSAWRPPRMARVTGWSPRTAASSTTATPRF